MPNTRNTGPKPATKRQAPKPAAAPTPTPKPEDAPAAEEQQQTPPPEERSESMFDETQSEPSAAEQPPVDPVVSGDASANDRPEGIEGEQEAPPPADPVLGNIPDTPTVDAAPVPETPADEPIAPTQVTDQVTDLASSKTEAAKQSFAEPDTVRLGGAMGFLHRMPLGDVLAYTEDFVDKIDALTHSSEVQDLQPRMRATEGRCAPIYFIGDDDGEPEYLIHGDRALSAAIALGLQTVSVVVIPHGDAGAAQAYLASEAGKSPASSEDDFLMQVNAYHSEDKPASPT